MRWQLRNTLVLCAVLTFFIYITKKIDEPVVNICSHLSFEKCSVSEPEVGGSTGLAVCLNYYKTNAGWCPIGTDVLSNHFLSRAELGDIHGRTGPRTITVAWGGAAVDTAGMRMYLHNAGHTDYLGTEFYEVDLHTGQMARLTTPAPLGFQILINSWYSAMPDPRKYPTGSHTYDGLLFVPDTGTILIVNSGRTSGWPVKAAQPYSNRMLLDASELGGIFEFNPSHTEVRNALQPLDIRKVSSVLLSYPRTAYKDGMIYLGSKTRIYTAALSEGGLILNNEIMRTPSAGSGTLTVQGNALISHTTSGHVYKWVNGTRTRVVQKAVVGRSSIACSLNECIAWAGGKEVSVFDGAQWTLRNYSSGPENGDSDVYSKFEYLPQYDIYVGVSAHNQPLWAYKSAIFEEL